MNRGFVFDAGDPSVGMFGTEWVHEECYLESDGGEDAVVDETQLALVRVDDFTIRTIFLLTCRDCAQQTLVSQDDYAPTDEAMDEMERQEREAEQWLEDHYFDMSGSTRGVDR